MRPLLWYILFGLFAGAFNGYAFLTTPDRIVSYANLAVMFMVLFLTAKSMRFRRRVDTPGSL